MEWDKMSKQVDINVYLPFMRTLIKKYDFKVSQDLHNYIIEKLADICDRIERGLK